MHQALILPLMRVLKDFGLSWLKKGTFMIFCFVDRLCNDLK